MVLPTIAWFHEVMGYTRQTLLNETLRQRYYHPQLRYRVERFKCDYCQLKKLVGRGYGLLPMRDLRLVPWEEVAIDLIVPWAINLSGRVEVLFHALTCIDMVSNLVELIRIDINTAEHVRSKFEQCWLAHYARPLRVVYDKGNEFIGSDF